MSRLVCSGPMLTDLPVRVLIQRKMHGREQVGLDLAPNMLSLRRRALLLTPGKQGTAALARQ